MFWKEAPLKIAYEFWWNWSILGSISFMSVNWFQNSIGCISNQGVNWSEFCKSKPPAVAEQGGQLCTFASGVYFKSAFVAFFSPAPMAFLFGQAMEFKTIRMGMWNKQELAEKTRGLEACKESDYLSQPFFTSALRVVQEPACLAVLRQERLSSSVLNLGGQNNLLIFKLGRTSSAVTIQKHKTSRKLASKFFFLWIGPIF